MHGVLKLLWNNCQLHSSEKILSIARARQKTGDPQGTHPPPNFY